MRIASFNVMLFASDPVRESALAEQVISADADLLTLQEVLSVAALLRVLDTASQTTGRSYTIRDPGGHWLSGNRIKTLDKSTSMKMLTAYDTKALTLHGWRVLQDGYPGLRKPTSVFVSTPAGAAYEVVNLHFKAGGACEQDHKPESGALRRAEAAFMAAWLQQSPAAQRPIVLGDFNAPQAHPSLEPFAALHPDWQYAPLANEGDDAWTVMTDVGGPLSFDHLLVPAGMQVVAAPRMGPFSSFSDHRMLVAEIA